MADERDELLVLVEGYRRRKRDLDVLDFADQIALAGEIARARPEVGAAERERYRLVLLDEYQDTSVAQRVLLQALSAAATPSPRSATRARPSTAGAAPRSATSTALPHHFPRADGGRPAEATR